MTHTTPSLPREVRPLVVLVALDVALGLWVHFHQEPLLAVAYGTQLPIAGLGAVLWGFLPKKQKDAFGEWLARKLAMSGLVLALGVIGVVLVGLSLTRSSIIITAVEPDVSATIAVVQGKQAYPDTTARLGALHLNRLTTPVRLGVWLLPWGRRVWLFSPTAVSFRDQTVWPWRPTSLNYPDDFVPLVVIAALPTPSVLSKLKAETYRLTLVAGVGSQDTLASGPLGPHGSLVSFFAPPPLTAELQASWRDAVWALVRTPARPDSADTANVNFVVGRWAEGWDIHNRVATRRPLQLGETLAWRLAAADHVAVEGTVKLDHPLTELYVVF